MTHQNAGCGARARTRYKEEEEGAPVSELSGILLCCHTAHATLRVASISLLLLLLLLL